MNSQNKNDYLGAQIRTARVLASLSQRQLSERTGVPVYRIVEIEYSGRIDQPDMIQRLCEELGIKTEGEG